MRVLTILLLLIMCSSCGPKVAHQITAEPIKIEMPPDFTIYQSIAFQRMYEELVAICLDLYSNNVNKLQKCKEEAFDTVSDVINEANREQD